MRKTKLVLLTVLLLLVLYCGAVVFVTKPDSFAYEALFNGIEGKVSVPTSEQKLAEEQAQREAISAEINSVASQKAGAAVNEAVMMAGIQTDDAINAAFSGVHELVEQAVADAFTQNLDADIQARMADVAGQVTANIEAGIDYYIPQIVEATIPALLQYQDEFAQMLYQQYGDQLVELIMAQLAVEAEPAIEETAEVVVVEVEAEPEVAEVAEVVEEAAAEAVEAVEPVAEEPAAEVIEMSQEEYEAIRQQTRETEINGMLDKLQD